MVFLSPPCRGSSALLSNKKARSPKFAALNRLGVRGVHLLLEAFADRLPRFLVLENVPRFPQRAPQTVEAMRALLTSAGYVVSEGFHNCGEIGRLGQSRPRYLFVARLFHGPADRRIPSFVYAPQTPGLISIGEALENVPFPGDLARGGPMHKLPNLAPLTWLRLAFIRAGRDWRDLKRLTVEDGQVRDWRLLPPQTRWHADVLGVRPQDAPGGTVTAGGSPTKGAFSVADPQAPDGAGWYPNAYGVRADDAPAGCIKSKTYPGCGGYSRADAPSAAAFLEKAGCTPDSDAVGDPGAPAGWDGGKYRVSGEGEAAGVVIGASATGNGAYAIAAPDWALASAYANVYRLTPRHEHPPVLAKATRPGSGALCTADPRLEDRPRFSHVYRLTPWDEPAGTVAAGASGPTTGAVLSGDPRVQGWIQGKSSHERAGHYGVQPLDAPGACVTAGMKHDKGRGNVADPQRPPPVFPEHWGGPPVVVLSPPDDREPRWSWHRPLTTLELALLQGFPAIAAGAPLAFCGPGVTSWRAQVGNAVPPPAACAMANVVGEAILATTLGRGGFRLDARDVWVEQARALVSVEV